MSIKIELKEVLGAIDSSNPLSAEDPYLKSMIKTAAADPELIDALIRTLILYTQNGIKESIFQSVEEQMIIPAGEQNDPT